MEKIRALIIQQITKVCVEVIGEDEEEQTQWQEDKVINQVRNQLRAEQRRRLNREIEKL